MSDTQSNKKRQTYTAESDDADSISRMICSRLSELTTDTKPAGSSQENEALLAAFLDVLDCPYNEAVFFLESSDWDVVKVSLFIIFVVVLSIYDLNFLKVFVYVNG